MLLERLYLSRSILVTTRTTLNVIGRGAGDEMGEYLGISRPIF